MFYGDSDQEIKINTELINSASSLSANYTDDQNLEKSTWVAKNHKSWLQALNLPSRAIYSTTIRKSAQHKRKVYVNRM